MPALKGLHPPAPGTPNASTGSTFNDQRDRDLDAGSRMRKGSMAEIDERLDKMKATGSEPGGGSGSENIEKHAGVASGQPTTTDVQVDEMGAPEDAERA